MTKTAAQEFAAKKAAIKATLEILEAQLSNIEEAHKAQPERWDIVGDMGRIHSALLDICFITE